MSKPKIGQFNNNIIRNNMTLINWILLAGIIVFTGIYIFSSILKIKMLRRISSCFPLPLAGILNIQFLLNQLPDSKHIIFFTIASVLFIILSHLFYLFKEKNWGRKLCKFSFFILTFCWIQLYKSVLFIIDVPLWFIILFSSIYFVLLVTTLIFGGTKSFSSYISCSGLFLASSLLNFFSMVYLCFISGLQAFFLFTGTLISLLVVAFYIIFDSRKFNFKNRLIFILFVLSESLIMYSNLLI